MAIFGDLTRIILDFEQKRFAALLTASFTWMKTDTAVQKEAHGQQILFGTVQSRSPSK